MFDGLKNKLNKFRKDVEETAEEKAEQADVEEEVGTASTAGTEAEAVEETAPTADDPSTRPESPDEVPAESDAAEPSGETETASTDADSTDAESETEAGTPTSDAATEDRPPEAGAAAEPVEEASTDADAPTGETGHDAADVPDDAPEAAAEEGDEPVSRRGVEPADEVAAVTEEAARKGTTAGRFKRAAAFATGKVIIEEEDLEEPLWELEMALLESDVEMNVAEQMLETIREKMIGETRAQVSTTAELVQTALHDALLEVISVGQFDFDERVRAAEKPVVIIFTGVNGVGKTTTIAKLSEYFEERGLSTVLANGDTYRAGANEQIRKHADNLGRKLISHEQGGDSAAVIYDAVEYADAHDVDVVLGDTAGRLHTSNDLMAQLEKIDRVVGPDMTLFVDEAVAGQDAVQRAKKFNEAAEIDGAVLTKADADSSGGAAISIAYVTGKPILFLGTGQGYGDIERFDPEWLADRLLGEE